MRKTKNFKTACKVLGITEDLPDVSKLAERYQKYNIDMHKASVITDAINKENNNWEPDYSDPSQWKYKPYFCFRAGVGFSFYADGDWNTDSYVGSRLVNGSREDAKLAAEIFLKEGLTI